MNRYAKAVSILLSASLLISAARFEVSASSTETGTQAGQTQGQEGESSGEGALAGDTEESLEESADIAENGASGSGGPSSRTEAQPGDGQDAGEEEEERSMISGPESQGTDDAIEPETYSTQTGNPMETKDEESSENITIKVTVSSGDTTADVRWTALDSSGGVYENSSGNISYYQICDANGASVGRTTDANQTAWEFTGLKNGLTYKYKIQAMKNAAAENGNDTIVADSELFSFTPQTAKPDTVTGLKATKGEDFILLSWTAAAKATSYYVEHLADNQWKRIAEVSGTSYTHEGLKGGTKHQYRVYSVRTSGGQTVCGDVSSVASAKVPENAGDVHGMSFSARTRSKTTVYTTKSGKKVLTTLSGGKKVTVTDNGGKRYQIKLASGKVGWVAKSSVRLTGSVVSKKDYTDKSKIAFVNSKKYKSQTKYLVWLSHYTQRTYIYYGSKGKWKLIRTCRISSGKHNMQTPKGVFKIIKKTNGWKKSSYYVRPAVEFKTGIWFHSRLKRYNGGLYDGTIGRPASHGCVRMYDEDINFMYKQVPKRTTVVSY